jgi:NAD(P)-dependent dehydrogenase (short-subunit alcohol dehydrogenase family)
MNMLLKDKVAVVTGAGTGIGKAIAILFAKEGAKVACVSVQPGNCMETARQIVEAGGTAVAVPADVSKSAEVKQMVQTVVETYGGINILVNNAGILASACKVGEVTEEDFDRSFNVNVKGQFLVAKMCLPVMIEGGGGVIVSMSSASAIVGQYNTGVYNATKAACLFLTKNIALDYAAQGIRANCLCPALVDNTVINKDVFAQAEADPEMWKAVLEKYPMGRIATPEEVAQGALYLASGQSSFVTGTTLVIDGGFTCL